tara:strand:+ start:1174 stop:2109 length:936 start_codon:yes stop_codon:yes gene_type:complete
MISSSQQHVQAWTFVEMLVAISLSAIFMGAASLVLGSITVNSRRLTSVVEVDIGESNKLNFYGQTGSMVHVYSAPNFGKAAFAQEMRDLMLDDASRSSSIFCLPRQLNNTIRPEFLRYVAGDVDATTPRPRLDSPEAFRSFLGGLEPLSTSIYDSVIRNVPAASRPNTSIYMLAPDSDPSYIRILAVYEIDLTPGTNVSGDYASVRRYKNGALTNYYDVFYENGSGDAFRPGFVTFESSARNAVTEGQAIDRFKVSDGNPFYLVWLPDPAINPYKVTAGAPTDPTSSPRRAYEHMAGKSSFLVALPMFPNL